MKGIEFQTVLAINGTRYRTVSSAARAIVSSMIAKHYPPVYADTHPDFALLSKLEDEFTNSNLPKTQRDAARTVWSELIDQNNEKLGRVRERFLPRVFDICVKAGLKPC